MRQRWVAMDREYNYFSLTRLVLFETSSSNDDGLLMNRVNNWLVYRDLYCCSSAKGSEAGQVIGPTKVHKLSWTELSSDVSKLEMSWVVLCGSIVKGAFDRFRPQLLRSITKPLMLINGPSTVKFRLRIQRHLSSSATTTVVGRQHGRRMINDYHSVEFGLRAKLSRNHNWNRFTVMRARRGTPQQIEQ